MSKPITFKIADISVSIAGDLLKEKFKIPQSYHPFIGSGTPDIQLRLVRGNPDIDAAKKVFESSPIWTLYRSNGQSIIKMYEEMSHLSRTLLLAPQFKTAELYFPDNSDGFLDPFFGPTLELLMLNFLGRKKGMVIHGCGIEAHGKGILFVGESGAGKSTLATLWDRQNTAKVLSDDRIIVRKIGDTFRMYGTPWHGESHFVSPRSVALEKMYFLRHGSQNEIRSLNGAAPVQQLLQCSFPPFWDAKGMEFALQYFSRLVSAVPCFDFSFTPDKSAIEYLALKI